MYSRVELEPHNHAVDHQQYPLDGGDGDGGKDVLGEEDSLIENARLVGFDDGVIGGLDEIEVQGHDSVFSSLPPEGGSIVPRASTDATSNQLTLSFRGQVYVFDAVTADKVQEVLLLLGGCEYAPGPNCLDMSYQNLPRGFPDYTGRCNDPKRIESLNRFRQKRKERNFEKKIRYNVRHEVALKMQRKKGQFAPRNADGSISTSDAVEESGQNDNPAETSCTHCGASSKSTPMMRKGPAGPRTLCNACGLYWANKGTLRSLSKKQRGTSNGGVAVAGEDDAESDYLQGTLISLPQKQRGTAAGGLSATVGEDDVESDYELGTPSTGSPNDAAAPAGRNLGTQAQL